MSQPYVPQIDEGEIDPSVSRIERAKMAYRKMNKATWGNKVEEFNTEEEKVEHQDGQTKAVIMMNLFCLANTGQCVLYKILDERHVASLLEYTLFRNLMIMGLSLILLMCQGRNPISAGMEMESWERRLLLFRAILGWLITFAINACLTMIPFTLLVILFQTSPFWTSIMGYKYNNEPLYKIEIFGMILCFICVIAITIDEKDEGDHIMST